MLMSECLKTHIDSAVLSLSEHVEAKWMSFTSIVLVTFTFERWWDKSVNATLFVTSE